MAHLPGLIRGRSIAHGLLLILALISQGCGRESALLQPLADDAVIMAFGDSLTFGTGADAATSYPAELARLLNRQVVNAGVPGEMSAAGLRRLARALTTHQPELVILCHGGNDILRNGPMAELEQNLTAMVELIRKHQAEVVMLGVPGRSLTLNPPTAYANVAAQLDVPIDADLLRALMGKRAFKSDQVHFNAAGYAAMAQGAMALISNAGGLASP